MINTEDEFRGMEEELYPNKARIRAKVNKILGEVSDALKLIKSIKVKDGKDADEEVIVDKVLKKIPDTR